MGVGGGGYELEFKELPYRKPHAQFGATNKTKLLVHDYRPYSAYRMVVTDCWIQFLSLGDF